MWVHCFFSPLIKGCNTLLLRVAVRIIKVQRREKRTPKIIEARAPTLQAKEDELESFDDGTELFVMKLT